MKSLKAAFISVVISILFVFLGFAFAMWSINPAEWGQETREAMAVISLTASPFVGIVAASVADSRY